MSTEKMRESFEAWHLTEYPGATLARRPNGEYVNLYVGMCWIGWQSSRAAIEVELPSPYAVIGDYAACGGGRLVWGVEYAEKITDRMCEKTPVYDRAQLEAAGLKVKPC